MSAGDDEPVGIRGPGDLGPRWRHVEQLFAELTAAYASGGVAATEPFARRIVEATLVPDVDALGLDIRARATSDLATVAEASGDLQGSVDLGAEAIALCLAAEAELGTARRTADVRVGALVNRAQTLALLGRHADGLADLNAADEALADDADPVVVFGVRNTRANALLSLERWEEAEAEFRAALDVALAHEPRLASYAYSGLASLLHATGDRAGGREHMRLARELQASGTVASAAADESLARMALAQGETEEAEELFARAERGYEAGGDPRKAAGCRYGRAAVLLGRGRLLPARRLAMQALRDFSAQGDVAACIETHLLVGDVLAQAARFADADEHYLRAREACAEQGTMHELARIDVRRAGVAHHAASLAVRPSERARRLEAALNLALPAALATDAMRRRFAPGPVRERWVTGVASVALSIAMQIIASMQHTRLAIELIEFAGSSATVDAGATTAGMQRLPVLAEARSPFRADEAFDPEWALAAAGLPSAARVDAAPALPPLVRAMPDGDTAFRLWIAEAERRYALGIRSSDVIDAW